MAAAATDDAVVLNIGEMIDLAIGTPEIGVVDFGMLHTLLHCLAQQLRVVNKNVELRGNIAALPVGRDHPQTVTVTEYPVDTEGKLIGETIGQPKAVTPASTQPDSISIGAATTASTQPDSILIVQREIRKPESKEHKKMTPQAKPPQSTSSHSHKTESAAPHVSPSTEKLSLVTISKFNVLENIVDDLRERVYGSIPKNEDILEEVRSQTNLKAITDMWTSLNVSSRLEAAETGIAKLSSLVQDLISDTGGLQDAFKEYGSKVFDMEVTQHPEQKAPADSATYETAEPLVGSVEQSVTRQGAEPLAGPIEQAVATVAHKTSKPRAGPAERSISRTAEQQTVASSSAFVAPTPTGAHTPVHVSHELAAVLPFLEQLQADVDKLTGDFYDAMAELKPDMERPERPPRQSLPTFSAAIPETPTAFKTTKETEETETETETETTPGLEPIEKIGRKVMLEADKLISTADITKRLNALERKLKECCETVNKQDGVVHDHINSFQDQLEYLSRQVASTQEFTGSKMTQDVAKDLPGLMKLFQTVQSMQEELKQVHETALQLAAEKEDRQDRINAIIEQIEVLKNIKLDREDMAEAMAEKADLRMLARKVSHDQFELACDDLSRGLDHALGKLNMQEALWQQALDDIQREIETKLDKMELSPVKEFFNNKLKQLQENLKQIASLRREVEAAGAKKKLMRDLNCLSCDAKVVMQMEAESTIPISKPLPANLSMKPYLSYELDTIRKTQASNIPQRNLHDWEHIDKQAQPSKTQQKVRSETDKHLCNRYCGGSHTMTTPAQRVARLGHFIKQWGPDVLPLSSGYTTGEDGRMYKISPSEGTETNTGGAVETACTIKLPTKKGDYAKLPEKRTSIVNAECRCLEDGKTTATKPIEY